MITKFEEYNEPQIGDYVQIKTLSTDPSFREFVNNSIGQLIEFKKYGLASEYNIDVFIKYDKIPNTLKQWFSINGTRVRKNIEKYDFIKKIDKYHTF